MFDVTAEYFAKRIPLVIAQLQVVRKHLWTVTEASKLVLRSQEEAIKELVVLQRSLSSAWSDQKEVLSGLPLPGGVCSSNGEYSIDIPHLPPHRNDFRNTYTDATELHERRNDSNRCPTPTRGVSLPHRPFGVVDG